MAHPDGDHAPANPLSACGAPTVHNLDRTRHGWHEFNIGPRYHSLNAIGRGAYGIVASALDLNTGKRVAIKKITSMELTIMALRTLREIRILRYLNHQNIIGINEIAEHDSYKEVYIIQPLIEYDLHRAMSLRNFDDYTTAYVMYQLFHGLKYIHSAQIIHRDIKPNNILIDNRCNIKICDFGLARVYSDADERDDHGMTEYVATRWYRAPEVMIAARAYDKAIDVWSAGCVMAELMSKEQSRVLFPGKHYMHMLQLMIGLLGRPSEEDLSYVKNPRAKEFILTQKSSTRVNWAEKYPGCSPEARNLLDRIMDFHPGRRITVEEALNHPFLCNFPSVPNYYFEKPLVFENNFYTLTTADAKRLIAEEAAIINSRPNIHKSHSRSKWTPSCHG